MKQVSTLLLILCAYFAPAQTSENPYIKKEFLIIHSGKDYPAALKKAIDASKKLKLKLNLRSLHPNNEIGLSCSQNTCENDFGFFPCYVPRGRSDDGAYVSIEYSDAYLEFEKGYYIVIAASFVSNSEKSKTHFAKTKALYKDAYLKSSKVYTGCIH